MGMSSEEQQRAIVLLLHFGETVDCFCDGNPDPECRRCAAQKLLLDLGLWPREREARWPDPPFRSLMEEAADSSCTPERIRAWEEAWGEMAARGHQSFDDLNESERAELRRKLPWYAGSSQLAPRTVKPS